MSESPLDGPSGFIKILVGVVLLLGFLYGTLALGNVLLSVLPAFVAGFLWLFYRLLRLSNRLVIAHERIADAQERRARAAAGDVGATVSGDVTPADARLDEFEADDRTDSDPETGGD